MAVPKKRTSSAKRDLRRVHHRITPLPVVRTATGIRLAHHADPDTGQYRGRQVVPVAGAADSSKADSGKTDSGAAGADKPAANKPAADKPAKRE